MSSTTWYDFALFSLRTTPPPLSKEERKGRIIQKGLPRPIKTALGGISTASFRDQMMPDCGPVAPYQGHFLTFLPVRFISFSPGTSRCAT